MISLRKMRARLLDYVARLGKKRAQLAVWKTDQPHEKAFVEFLETIAPSSWQMDAASEAYLREELAFRGGFGEPFLPPFVFRIFYLMHTLFNPMEIVRETLKRAVLACFMFLGGNHTAVSL